MRYILFFLHLLVGPQLLALDLVKQGQATGEFVIGQNPHKAVLWSVTDVRHWIHKMAGVNVPILNEASAKNNTKVFVGRAYAADWKADLAKLKGTDGYAIRNKGKKVYVFGTRPRGTLYGVIALLERNSDIIWARPNRRFGTVFGKSKNLKLTQIDLLNKPVFHVRHQGGHFRPFHQDTQDWQVRNLSNQVIGPNLYLDMIACHHDIPYWLLSRTLKKKDYLNTHPEIFSYVDKFKKRIGSGVCYMNPKLDEIYFKEMMTKLEAQEKHLGKKVEYINSHMGDSWQCCECKLCLAPIKLRDGSYLNPKDPSPYKDPVFRSTQYYMFYSRIMERLKKVRPDVKLCVLAYIYSAAVPRIPPHPDLQVIFCPYPTSNMHFPMLDPRQPKLWRERFAGWLKITRRFGMREYYNASTIAPISLTSQKDLLTFMTKQDKDNIAIVTETRDDIGSGDWGWDLAAMEMWIINHLFWDPTQDMEKLRLQFIERTYREAAPAMTRYYDLIRESWMEPQDRTIWTYHVSNQYIYENLIVKKGREEECLKHLSDALAMAKHPNSRIMIKRLYDILRSVNQDLGKLMIANIPEMFQDGTAFESVQWEKPLPLTAFRKPFLYKVPNTPSNDTTVKAGHDGRFMYIRFDAEDSNPSGIDAMTGYADENFLKGDHIELWLYHKNKTYLFSFNSKGAKYDSMNLDKTWTGKWELVTQKTDTGWNAIVKIPLTMFHLEPGAKQNYLKWTALREMKQKGKNSEVSIFKGMSLHYKKFDAVVE